MKHFTDAELEAEFALAKSESPMAEGRQRMFGKLGEGWPRMS
jgi:hypothetical protein